MPALLTRISTSPIACTICAWPRSTAPGSEMSKLKARTCGPSSRARTSLRPPLASTMATLQPSTIRALATARPITPAEPVTSATLPASNLDIEHTLLSEQAAGAEGHHRDEQQVHGHQRPFGSIGAGQGDHHAHHQAGHHRTPQRADAAQHDDQERGHHGI